MNIIELAEEYFEGLDEVCHPLMCKSIEAFATAIAKQAVEEYKAGLVPVATVDEVAQMSQTSWHFNGLFTGLPLHIGTPLYALGVNEIDERLGETK
jgi:hypothetical protein